MIKAIAVDKDGTFFKSDHTYDLAYFEQLYKQMEKQQIKFIVASGNQYEQLRSFFPSKDQKIVYVAENGALTYFNNELLAKEAFVDSDIHNVIKYLQQTYHIENIILGGIKTAYMLKGTNQTFIDYAQLYYKNITFVDNFSEVVDDTFIKVAMRIQDTNLVTSIIEDLQQRYSDVVRAVTSGNDSVDLLVPTVNKGKAIQALLDKWGIANSELLAFGDANNDIEMLQLTPHSYAMASCSPELARVAQYRAPSNDDSGVLQVIEQYLQAQE
ncbi:Cof-type HAD-IIB family hydrolase [Staphylococcus arlettae]|uniref:Cof-type HAD-IIB family hydrolase n=1 Tax=Staphylococcus arlettae TaxID=29378 RepID=UPI00028236CB|nr:Cof-type HAD-IIB family hydrolase [Staphylococcus arlettae]EJY96865.1 hydrolase [Staphylococcus arlettae CVD059]MDT3895420.1 Cof-type HAD-IIB family hydrolase [Staphylococcus arlettae]